MTPGFKGLDIRSRPLSFADQAAGSRPSATIIASGVVFSTITVSTTAAIGCCTFRAAFFTGARLGFVVATVRFLVADFATLRALPRLAEFAHSRGCPLLNFRLLLSFGHDRPPCGARRYNGSTVIKRSNASYQQIAVLSAPGLALSSLVGLGVGRKPPSSSANPVIAVYPRE
jgi:hypothetical protein